MIEVGDDLDACTGVADLKQREGRGWHPPVTSTDQMKLSNAPIQWRLSRRVE